MSYFKQLPQRPEDMVDTPPLACDFKVGDTVTFTNEYGAQFDRIVFGFASAPHNEYKRREDARFIYVFTDAWWFPVAPKTLRHREVPKDIGTW